MINADKFRNRYRIPSARMRSWDYSHDGMYFITICTHNRECFFGKIINKEMHLTGIGEITEQQWVKTPEMRPDMNLELDVFVVMPNHFHRFHQRDRFHRHHRYRQFHGPNHQFHQSNRQHQYRQFPKFHR